MICKKIYGNLCMLCTACYLMFKHTWCIERTYIGQCRLNACARWAVAHRPHEHRGPMLI